MEQKFRKSMIGATLAEKKEFSSEIANVKRDCDSRFLKDFRRACASNDKSCLRATRAYYAAVDKLASRAFKRAVDGAFTCRTK
jgi:hypothetical protein